MLYKFIFNLFILIVVSVSAESKVNLNKWYVGMSHGIHGTEPSPYFHGAENLSNTVGTGGVRTEIEVGKVVNSDIYKRAFIYSWKNDSAKNNEQGIGIGLRAGKFVSDNLAFTIGAKSGLGEQDVSGKTFMTQSGTSNVSFITNNSGTKPTPGKFNKNTNVFEVGLLFDMDYFITNNININLGVGYILSVYDFSYELPDGKFVIDSGTSQDNYQAKIGLNFNF